MPTYGYECTACKNQIEVFQSIKDAPLETCESCGGTLRKLIYPVGIAFKGSGFYVNDYASKPGTTKPGTAASEGSSASSSEAKTDVTPTTTDSPKTEASPATTPKAETKVPAVS